MSNSCIILSVREKGHHFHPQKNYRHFHTAVENIINHRRVEENTVTNHNFAKNGPGTGGLVSFLIN